MSFSSKVLSEYAQDKNRKKNSDWKKYRPKIYPNKRKILKCGRRCIYSQWEKDGLFGQWPCTDDFELKGYEQWVQG